MKKVLFTTFCLFFLFNTLTVKASECNSEDINRLKALASSITYNSEFIGNKENMNLGYQTYSINFVGMTDEIYISDVYNSLKVTNDNDVILVQSGIRNVEVYSKYCDNKRLKTITINLPKFNTYSLDSYCDNVSGEELYVCDPWYQGNITFDSFLEAIDDYEIGKEQKNKTFEDEVYGFLKDYYYIIVPIVIVSAFIITILIVRRVRKNKLY